MDKIEMKPCPFCGRRGTAIRSERVSNSGVTLYAVRCYRCGAEGPMTYGYGDSQLAKETAAAFWNVEYTIYIPDDEFDENEDPIEEIEDYYNDFIDEFQTESRCVSVEEC